MVGYSLTLSVSVSLILIMAIKGVRGFLQLQKVYDVTFGNEQVKDCQMNSKGPNPAAKSFAQNVE